MSGVFSMTGFASAEGSLADGRSVSLSLKSVNHRHLDLALRLPAGMDALEPALRKAVKAAVRRGHVELTLTLGRLEGAAAIHLNSELLRAYAAVFADAAATLNLTQEPSVEALLRLPGVLTAGIAPEAGGPAAYERVAPELLGWVEKVLQRFLAARAAEGEALALELRAGMNRLAEFATEAARLRAGVAAAEFARLKTRMADLLGDAAVSEDRLLQEAALLAGRGDVEEELVRLRTHIARFTELLLAGGEVGRALDFLLQEMNREANTVLSKTGASAGEAGLRLTELGLSMKAELERAREQVQNLE